NDDRELRDWLDKGMQRLSPDQRMVIELVYGVGHKLEEVAEIMQCPVGTIKARLFHARVKLRNVLPGLAGGAPYTETMQ
ncbi:RNA polymerase sigma factor, partial [Xanthomonas hortorum]